MADDGGGNTSLPPASIQESLHASALRSSRDCGLFITHDMRLYREAIYDRLNQSSTLITGETGTGKEGVARAIALSRYIPFDPRARSFAADPAAGFHALSVAAINATFVGSHLFGHVRGMVPGALEDCQGCFETCGPYGAVFFDDVHCTHVPRDPGQARLTCANCVLVLAARAPLRREFVGSKTGVCLQLWRSAIDPLYIDAHAEIDALCHKRLQRFSSTGLFRHPAARAVLPRVAIRRAG